MTATRPAAPARRRWLRNAAGLWLPAAALIAGHGGLVHAAPVGVTPSQSLGPFYPVDWDGDVDADLVVVRGEAARALGTVMHVRGQVRDVRGGVVAGAWVEIWQVDARGVYRHPRDTSASRRTDPGFQGYGRVRTDAEGRYAFRTIRPVPYPGRTPHVHVRVAATDGRTLVTQMYLADEPGNARDFLLNAIADPRERARLIVAFAPAERLEPGAIAGEFDLVLPAAARA